MQALNAEQKRQWAVDGYLQLPQVLSADEVEVLSAQVDDFRAKPGYEPADHPQGHYLWMNHCEDLESTGFMDRRHLLAYHHAFIDLIDRPGIFDRIVDLMGPHILFSMSQAIVRPSTTDFPGFTHTDGGEALAEVRVTETSRPVAIKAMYLLTDVREPDSGNLTVFPGSHMRPFPVGQAPYVTPYSPGAAQLMGKAGDCILFPHSLWHGPARNQSGHARKAILYNYCQMFVRAYDFETTPDVLQSCTPRQRRLLGDLGYEFRPGSYFYTPEDQVDVICNP